VGCAEPGYPGAYTRTGCFLGFIAEQFGLKADFSRANEHPDWSTDCPNGASRRSSALHWRKSNRKDLNTRKKKKNKRKSSGTGRDGLTTLKSNDVDSKEESAEIIETTTMKYVSRDKIITIEDIKKKASSGENKEKKNKRKQEKIRRRKEKKKRKGSRGKKNKKNKKKDVDSQQTSKPLLIGFKTLERK